MYLNIPAILYCFSVWGLGLQKALQAFLPLVSKKAIEGKLLRKSIWVKLPLPQFPMVC